MVISFHFYKLYHCFLVFYKSTIYFCPFSSIFSILATLLIANLRIILYFCSRFTTLLLLFYDTTQIFHILRHTYYNNI